MICGFRRLNRTVISAGIIFGANGLRPQGQPPSVLPAIVYVFAPENHSHQALVKDGTLVENG